MIICYCPIALYICIILSLGSFECSQHQKKCFFWQHPYCQSFWHVPTDLYQLGKSALCILTQMTISYYEVGRHGRAKIWLREYAPGVLQLERCHHTTTRFPIIKIKRSHARLAFMMGILIPGRMIFVRKQPLEGIDHAIFIICNYINRDRS